METVERERGPGAVAEEALDAVPVGGLDADAPVQAEPTPVGQRFRLHTVAIANPEVLRSPVPSIRFGVNVSCCFQTGEVGAGIGCSDASLPLVVYSHGGDAGVAAVELGPIYLAMGPPAAGYVWVVPPFRSEELRSTAGS